MWHKLQFCLLLSFCVLFGTSADQTEPLESFSVPVWSNIRSPVDSSTPVCSSPFGPRLKASEGSRYDFHRGIDIQGSSGDLIYAVADGQIYNVYEEGSASYPDGGNVVILEHALDESFEFQGRTVDKIYTLYMHLNSFGADAQTYLATGIKNTVSKGDVIGTMGNSGTTDTAHLHFETRLGTVCSLEYQLAHPTYSCAAYNFDPHINPLTFYVDGLNPDDFSIELTNVTNTQATISVEAQPASLIIDGVEFEILSRKSLTSPSSFMFSRFKSTQLHSATLSFNTREGFNAMSTESLDNPEIDGFTVSPAAFNSSSEFYEMIFTADVPASVWMDRNEIVIRATLLTTLGEVGQIEQIVSR